MSVTLKAPDTPTGQRPDPEAYALGMALRSLVSLGAATAPRSLSRAVGASQLGAVCDRRLAYKLAGTPPVNLTDPLRALVGVGVHLVLADMFRRLDQGAGRFLVETPVTYRGVHGTCDLYDRWSGTVVDWKSTLKAKLSHVRAEGPSPEQVVQCHTYGAGLTVAGEKVRTVALVYVPVDGGLDDWHVWRAPYDQTIVDGAVDRLNQLAQVQLTAPSGRLQPSTVTPTPTVLCGWCEHHNAASDDTDRACPGNQKGVDHVLPATPS
jgi:hypothetical protein